MKILNLKRIFKLS